MLLRSRSVIVGHIQCKTRYNTSVFRLSSTNAIDSISSRLHRKTPITVLSGFLGAGKTTFLQHALTNQDGKKYGLLVNDMATVNVDSKLIKKTSVGFDGVDTLELQNGCVCCSLAGDMLLSLYKLIQMSEAKNTSYDHIIVECSGIAEPRKIADIFRTPEMMGDTLTSKVELDTLVTVVDASTFMKLFGTDQDMMSNSSLAISEDGKNMAPMDDTTGIRRVTDLLIEQVEFADTILVNKVDLLSHQDDIELVRKVVKSMNPSAKVLSCVRGQVDPLQVIGSRKSSGVALLGILDQHRGLVQAVESGRGLGPVHGEEGHVCDSTCDTKDAAEGHSHDHDHTGDTCTHPSHSHDHDHTGDTCTHPSHSHDHDHTGDTCTHPSHSHDHDHATCKDPTHDHSHSHEHASDATTAETRFGITSFVYKRRRPFHPNRFTDFLNEIGELSVKGLYDFEYKGTSRSQTETEVADSAMRRLLRSKGFVWMATSAAGAYYMSHAGQFLELVVLGRWWADIKREEWPEASKSEILVDFDTVGPHGDRRQELVFIGQFSANESKDGKSQRALEEVLDSCLLTDDEMKTYETISPKGDNALRTAFFKNS